MTEAQIKERIDKFKKLIEKTDNTQSKKDFQSGIDKLEKMLADMKKDESKKPVEKPKAEPKKPVEKPKAEPRKPVAKTKSEPRKPVAKPKTEPRKPVAKTRGVKMLSSRKVSVDGNEMNMDSQEFCDYLLSEFKKRRQKAEETKTKSKKTKTKSVMAKVTDSIEKGVTQAIKESVKNQKVTIEKDPKAFFSKVKKLETATKSFLQELKTVLGKDFDAKEVTSTVKGIQDMVNELKKKIEK